ncbi:hypothetical protein E8E14_001905 [Neopestalotiopsis sp. 37M]|nr:hypothetical protein E8E14_001905 [Neopestalotiopsis sp. 37M]
MIRAQIFVVFCSVLSAVKAFPHAGHAVNTSTQTNCRLLHTDSVWPDLQTWDYLNQTVGGRLIHGTPLGQPCYSQEDVNKCTYIQDEWTSLETFVVDPVNVMSPYWANNSCSPFLTTNTTCTMGNLASYAINVSSADDVVAGARFAQDNNIRLTIKNSGHDFLGRSSGASSLALWMHNLNNIAFLNYSSDWYNGPAARVETGVEYLDLYTAASEQGYRVVGGSCSSVAVAGGYSQGGGHGPLSAAYGLAADEVLEWEVVLANGSHITVSPSIEPELYWALSGGGAGNFAVVLSMTIRAHQDGPVVGASFSFGNNGDEVAYWAAIQAWLQHLLVLDAIDGLTTVWTFTAASFMMEFATLPDATTTDAIDSAMNTFFDEVSDLNISIADSYSSGVSANFAEHYDQWAVQTYTSNISIGGRLIPRAAVEDEEVTLPALVSAFRDIASGGARVIAVATNVTQTNHTSNAVLPAWRDTLFTTTFAKSLPVTSDWDHIRSNQAQLNLWQDTLRNITPGGGTYMNEATWDNVEWKTDYYGSKYDDLVAIKDKYDPNHLFWANAAAGSDTYWKTAEDGRLCRV